MKKIGGLTAPTTLACGAPLRLRRVAAACLMVGGLSSFPLIGAEAQSWQSFGLETTGSPQIGSAAQAARALMDHRLTDIAQLGPVGDYWEANARADGKPVVVYLFDDGSLRIVRHPAMMVQMGTRSTPTRHG